MCRPVTIEFMQQEIATLVNIHARQPCYLVTLHSGRYSTSVHDLRAGICSENLEVLTQQKAVH